MGRPSVKFVIRKLQEAGFRAGRAYPGSRMPRIQVPAVTVAIFRDEEALQRLAVTVFVPEAMGGIGCEDTACQVTAAMRGLGYDCAQEHCQYDGKGDRFSIRILATWTDEPPVSPVSVYIGSLALRQLTQLTAVQKTTEEAVGVCGSREPGALLRRELPWVLTLEEDFPGETGETASPAPPFTVKIRRGRLGEVYENCRWTEIRRQTTAQGLHQVRTALAESRRTEDLG